MSMHVMLLSENFCTKAPVPIKALPPELSRLILERCDNADMVALRGTCRGLKHVVDDFGGIGLLSVKDFLSSPRRVRLGVRLGMPLSATTFALAAKTADVTVLETLRRFRCRHNSLVCMHLARRGDLVGLRWARKNNFAWNFLCCAVAVDGGCYEIVRWLGQKHVKCPCNGTYH